MAATPRDDHDHVLGLDGPFVPGPAGNMYRLKELGGYIVLADDARYCIISDPVQGPPGCENLEDKIAHHERMAKNLRLAVERLKKKVI